jgi:hypothetical protein
LSPLLVGEKLLVGANFASAGVGILDDTGFQFVSLINFIFIFLSRQRNLLIITQSLASLQH